MIIKIQIKNNLLTTKIYEMLKALLIIALGLIYLYQTQITVIKPY